MQLEIEPIMHMEIFSHFFKVVNPTPRAIQLIMKFCGRYVQVTQMREKDKNNKQMPYKVFAARVKDNTEFRFHVGQLSDFMTYLDYNYVTPDMYTVRHEPMYAPYATNTALNKGWALRDFQEEVREFIINEDPNDNHSRLVCLPTGTGKAQPLDSFIQIPNGWKRMGDIQVGDTVIAKDGSHTRVKGVYPQGFKQIYRITFQDGRDVECCEDHLWNVLSYSVRNRWKVMSTKELIRKLEVSEMQHYIQLVDPYDGEDAMLYIEPYKLGTYIADEHDDVYDTIPMAYLTASLRQRIALLNGIMDTAGNINVHGIISFRCTVERLAIDVQYLVRSLGGIASILPSLDGYYFRVTIRLKNGIDIFMRKASRVRLSINSKQRDILNLKITSIEKTEVKEAQCISIEHPDQLYVTDHFIVTHNTVTALASVATLGHRTAIVILPSYIEKWASDITTTLNVKAKEIMLIRGSKQLQGLIDMSIEGNLDAKFIIISIRTIQNFYKAYELCKTNMEEEGYGCLPEDLFKTLGVGNIIVDEAHMHLYAVFKTLLYTHIPKVIALSATLISNDHFVRNIQHMMFPKEIRFDKVKMDQYIRVFSVAYQFKDLVTSRVRTSEYGSTNYSHIAYEKSILKNRASLEGYLKIIDYLIGIGYMEDYIEGDKLAIYAASIAMCDAIMGYIKQKYPKYDVRRYVESDPYENVIDADIRVSTILSSGTAIDIPNLRTVIMTTNVSSPVANLQTLGRLRKLPDRDAKFYYIYCDQIKKQVNYHREKMSLFQDRVASIKEFRHPYYI